jgi:hypothetical protein
MFLVLPSMVKLDPCKNKYIMLNRFRVTGG